MKTDATALMAALGYSFQDDSLLVNAVTHTSFVKGDGRNTPHNERLEFLGDAVLELCVSEHLYRRHPDMQEGQMTRARARLVCEEALFKVALALDLPAYLRLGNGEELSGGREKPSIVSDALEAVIGAIYLDGGLVAARGVVVGTILELLEDAQADAGDKDSKTSLQELVQRDHMGTLRYELVSQTGPEHHKVFTMRVLLSNREIGSGAGSTKQSAGQEAARRALALLSNEADGE